VSGDDDISGVDDMNVDDDLSEVFDDELTCENEEERYR